MELYLSNSDDAYAGIRKECHRRAGSRNRSRCVLLWLSRVTSVNVGEQVLNDDRNNQIIKRVSQDILSSERT